MNKSRDTLEVLETAPGAPLQKSTDRLPLPTASVHCTPLEQPR